MRVSHVIVCGLGQVGYRVTLLLIGLGESVEVVTMDARPGFVDEVESLGAVVHISDARDQKSLVRAKIESAKAVIACTSSDLANIEIALDARALRSDVRIVARIFDQNLAQRLKESVGIDETLAMSLLAAPKFAAEALQENVLGQFNWKGKEYTLKKGEGVGVSLKFEELGLVHLSQSGEKASYRPLRRPKRQLRHLLQGIPQALKILTAVIALLGVASVGVFCYAMNLSVIDSVYFVVTTLTTTGYGDITVKDQETWVKLYACWMMVLGSAAVATLYSIITDTIVSSKFADLLGSRTVDIQDHVVVVGLGNVGFRICQSLNAAGVAVIAVDSNGAAPFRNLLPKAVPFIVGDGRESETLRRASVHQSQAVISTTDDDAVNLSVGLAARALKRETRTVLRLFDERFARKVESNLDIDRALSASLLSAPGFVTSALYPDAIYSFALGKWVHFVEEKEGAFTGHSIPCKVLS